MVFDFHFFRSEVDLGDSEIYTAAPISLLLLKTSGNLPFCAKRRSEIFLDRKEIEFDLWAWFCRIEVN